MLKMFKKLFRHDPSARRDAETKAELDVDEDLSDMQIFKEYFSLPKHARQSLRRFMLLISRHLGARESERLANRVMSFLHPGLSGDDAVFHGLFDGYEEAPGKWLFIHLVYKTVDEVERQANGLLRAHGVAAAWHAARGEGGSTTQALLALAAWVRQHGLNLLCLRMSSGAFLVRDKDLSEVRKLAAEAGLELQRDDEFAWDN